ncbi:hypothetical protein ACFOEE_08535 [Pseudoalteromonas fenneropenaei]|uniref:Tellurium resistance protein TerC n=1 Tax=Pseudoalteromonas fenneropenaei TaxID=1737459 RepID=A0ABV7CIW5_9GAMM
MSKLFYYAIGSLFVLLALVFVVVPGPSILFLLAALLSFSMVNEKAKTYLRKTQKGFKIACVKMDNWLKK